MTEKPGGPRHRSGQIRRHLGSGPGSSLILGHRCAVFTFRGTCFHQELDQLLPLPPHTGRPHDSGLEDADEEELGSWLCIWRRGHREWRTNRKVGTCPVTSGCRMIFVTSSFGVCLQPFLVVLAAGPPPTLRSLLPLGSVPGLAVFCQWPDSGNS